MSQVTKSGQKRKRDILLSLEKPSFSHERIEEVKKTLFSETDTQSPSKHCLTTNYLSISPSGTFVTEDISQHKSLPTRNVRTQANIKKSCRSLGVNTIIKQESKSTMTILNEYRIERNLAQNDSPISKNSTRSTFSSSSDFLASPQSSEISSGNDPELELEDRKYSQIQRRKSTIQLIETHSRFYLGLPEDVYFLVNYLSDNTFSLRYEHVLIVLKKIRLNDVHFVLAADFGISVTYVSNIFNDTVPKMANILQNFIFWPNNDVVKRLLPITFRYRYGNVKSIIDCLEIEIEKPSDPLKQSLTWSEYKKCNTIKYLVSCTPNGFINFISGGFGGRITDNNIITLSNYLQELPDNVTVMADRGFKQIDMLLLSKNCTLVRPPSVSTGEKSSRDGVKQAKRIAALRIHVERVIRRIREFHMLSMHSCINTNLIHLLNHIVIIACAIINFQEPILKG